MITAKQVITMIEGLMPANEKQEMSNLTVSISSSGTTPASLEGLEKVIQKKLGSPLKNINRSNDKGTLSFEVLHDDAEELKTNLMAMLKANSLTGSVNIKAA